MNQEEDPVDNSHDEREKEWQKVLISNCFTSALSIALHFHQITDSKLDSLHLVCVLVAIIFSCLFVSHFINPAKFPKTSKVRVKWQFSWQPPRFSSPFQSHSPLVSSGLLG
jgi:hypothetical protein